MEFIKIEDDITSSLNLFEDQMEEDQFIIYIKSEDQDPLIAEDSFIKDNIADLGISPIHHKSDDMFSMMHSEESSPTKKDDSNEASVNSFLILSPVALPSPKKVDKITPKKKCIQIKSPSSQPIPKPDFEFDFLNDFELEEEKELRLYLDNFSEEESVQCPKCFTKYANKVLLERHFAIHLIRPPYTCPMCEKTQRNPGYLLQHFLQHTDFPFICQRCNTAFRVKDDLLNHEAEHPGGIEPSQVSFNSMVRSSTFKKLLHEFLIRQAIYSLDSKETPPQKKLGENDNSLDPPLFIIDPNPLLSRKLDEPPQKKKKKSPQKRSPLSSQKVLRVDMDLNFTNIDIELEEEKEIRLYLENFGENEVVQCPKCPIKFVNKCLLEQHYACHLVKPPFICPLCEKLSKNTTCLLQHFRQHTEFPFICQECNTAFKVESDLKKHSLQHPGGIEPSEISLGCKLRTLTFKKLLHEFLIRQAALNAGGMYPHFKKDLVPIIELPELCLKNSTNPPLLQSLGNDVELQEERDLRLYLSKFSNKEVVKCMKCQVKFANKLLLEQHYIIHLIKPPLVCPVCERELKAVPSFISHLRHHAKSIGCHKCNLMFKEKKDLESHLLVHSKDELANAAHKNDGKFFKRIVHEFLFRQSQTNSAL